MSQAVQSILLEAAVVALAAGFALVLDHIKMRMMRHMFRSSKM